jgi:uncharacterized protein (TIGR01244 family)
MKNPRSPFLVLAALLALPVAAGARQSAQAAQASAAQASAPQGAAQSSSQAAAPKSELPGVRNFTRVDATFACGGALSSDAMAAIKEAGFKSVVNLRAANEEGANVEAETKAAKEAGVTYVWLPFVTASPDAAKVDEFLEAVVDPANQPMLLHCASGGRASMFWAIKRVVIDGWPVEKAMNELPDLSKNVSAPLKAFTLGYIEQHAK